MDTPTLTVGQAREDWSETVSRVAFRGDRLVLERHGKAVCAMVPMDDLDVIEALEDRMDLTAARKALKEEGTVAWHQIKKRLNL